jgi:murein L,D-transpeptidase YcbB/YkuD
VLDRAALASPDAGPLKAALAKARAVAAQGGWERIPGGAPNETIEPGVTDPLRVPLLRARLAGEDPRVAGSSPVYDAFLQDAVRRFQHSNAIEADGRIGRISLAALNRSPEAAVTQLRANLDMRRAVAPPAAERRIEVNVPHQWLQVLDGDRPVLEMAVVVGKPARATPMLRVRMNSVQFNPSWGVPERNAREDLLPRFRRDPAGMQAKGFRLYGMVDGERMEIDPTTVDWSSINPNRFPYFIRQDAGDRNALGRIKFTMPNSDDIYMHDTPDRHLFRRPDRAFSSGCIRLEKPMELLDIVMAGTTGWSRERVDRVLASRQTAGASLARTFPVRLHYTSVIVQGDEVRMRSDIYGLDEAYVRALDQGAAAGRARMAAHGGGGR